MVDPGVTHTHTLHTAHNTHAHTLTKVVCECVCVCVRVVGKSGSQAGSRDSLIGTKGGIGVSRWFENAVPYGGSGGEGLWEYEAGTSGQQVLTLTLSGQSGD